MFKIVPGRIDHEVLSLPVEIVMMGDDRYSGFRNQLGEGQAEGKVERNGQRVLRHQQVNLIFIDECVKMVFQIFDQSTDVVCYAARPHPDSKTVLINVADLRMGKVGLSHPVGSLGGGVEFAGKVVVGEAFLLENPGPFLGLEADAVRTGQPCRYKTDPVCSTAVSACFHWIASRGLIHFHRYIEKF